MRAPSFVRISVDLKYIYESIKYRVKKRCRLSLLTNRALVYEPKCGGGVAGSQPMSTALHMEPKLTLEV